MIKPVIIKGLVKDESERANLTGRLLYLYEKGESTRDVISSEDGVPAVYKEPLYQDLQLRILPFIEKVSGCRLLPTYTYSRMYKKDCILKIHKDRPSCEVSVTLQVNSSEDVWPIYTSTKIDKSDAVEHILKNGDALVYKGCDWWHWREQYKGNFHHQIFLHYVDADGPNKHFVNDTEMEKLENEHLQRERERVAG
jgi:hypothetical protein